jgi:ankyrin repeat protein
MYTNLVAPWSGRSRDGSRGCLSMLQAAVIAGYFQTCRLLLHNGADPDQQDRDGDTLRECARDDPEL